MTPPSYPPTSTCMLQYTAWGAKRRSGVSPGQFSTGLSLNSGNEELNRVSAWPLGFETRSHRIKDKVLLNPYFLHWDPKWLLLWNRVNCNQTQILKEQQLNSNSLDTESS